MLFNKLFIKAKAETATSGVSTENTRSRVYDPLQSFMFEVQFDDGKDATLARVGFTKVSGLSKEMSVVEYLEACFEHKHKLAGREEIGEITLEKGMFATSEMYDMFKSVTDPSNDSFRHTVSIIIKNRAGEPKRKFLLGNSWVNKYELGDLDATSDDVIVETMTLQAESLDEVPVAS